MEELTARMILMVPETSTGTRSRCRSFVGSSTPGILRVVQEPSRGRLRRATGPGPGPGLRNEGGVRAPRNRASGL
jgi:hypothetical protein